MTYRIARLILIAVIGILALTACGSDSEDVPSLRNAEDVQAAEPTASAADKVLDNEAKMMAFTQCLRDQGLDVLDPVVDADGNVGKPEPAGDGEFDKVELRAAWEACEEHLEGFSYEKENIDISEQVDYWFGVTTCLRDKGYDLDEPTAETLDQWLGDFKAAFDFDDPDESADFEECSGRQSGGKKGK